MDTVTSEPAAKLLLLSAEDHARVAEELGDIMRRLVRVSNVLEPAYGSAWGDKAIRAARHIMALRADIDGRFFKQTGPGTAKAPQLGDEGWDALAGEIEGWREPLRERSAPVVPHQSQTGTQEESLPIPQFLRRVPERANGNGAGQPRGQFLHSGSEGAVT
jgi:hypothetical protein